MLLYLCSVAQFIGRQVVASRVLAAGNLCLPDSSKIGNHPDQHVQLEGCSNIFEENRDQLSGIAPGLDHRNDVSLRPLPVISEAADLFSLGGHYPLVSPLRKPANPRVVLFPNREPRFAVEHVSKLRLEPVSLRILLAQVPIARIVGGDRYVAWKIAEVPRL